MNSVTGRRFALLLTVWATTWPTAAAAQTTPLIFYRYTFFTMSPSELAPPYWINMGAVAISTLAGTTLVAAAPHSPLLHDLLPFLKGFSLLFWAAATWGAVFPLGMYAVCTFRLANIIDAPFLLIVPRVFLYTALVGWTLTMAGLVRSLIGSERVA